MRQPRALQAVAALAGAAGVVAVVSRSSWAAVVAGVAAVISAGGSLRLLSSSSAVDLRDGERAEDGSGTPTLLDERYLEATLRSRIAVAKRALRPLSVVHVEVLAEVGQPALLAAEQIAGAAEATLRASDVVGRHRDGHYVFILEDTGEDGAVWTTERLRRHLVNTLGPGRFHAGVASYPNHGLDADAVTAKAADALVLAREWGRDRIEVAATP